MEKIFYIMGKSASGKDTIYKNILENEELGLKRIVLYTTRPIRDKEQDGRDYFFTSDEKIEEFILQGKMIELRAYQTIHGIWKYCTVNDGKIDLKRNSYLGIGTLESYERMQEYFGKDILVPIYIEVDDGLRLERALERERKQEIPKYSEMCRRFLADESDFSETNIIRAGIEKKFQNRELKECIDEVSTYIKTIRGK